MSDHPIVVGYDGSPEGRAALRWALSEGSLRGLPVEVVTVLDRHGDRATGPVPAGSALEKVVSEAITEVPEVVVTGRALAGPVSAALCDRSREASLMVLGHRGRGGFAGLLGSVSLGVTAHGRCPVVVVREGVRRPAEAPVVLGVDDCANGRLAAEFAFREAAAHKVAVVAVHATPSTVDGRAERALVDRVLTEARRLYAEVRVDTVVVAGSPAAVLVEWSRRARLVVTGSRGRGGLPGRLLGSVSHQVLHHAYGPVAVVHDHVVADDATRPGVGR